MEHEPRAPHGAFEGVRRGHVPRHRLDAGREHRAGALHVTDQRSDAIAAFRQELGDAVSDRTGGARDEDGSHAPPLIPDARKARVFAGLALRVRSTGDLLAIEELANLADELLGGDRLLEYGVGGVGRFEGVAREVEGPRLR